eukprot:scaffold29442_cov107-Isochrysis_galbana.AAC.1
MQLHRTHNTNAYTYPPAASLAARATRQLVVRSKISQVLFSCATGHDTAAAHGRHVHRLHCVHVLAGGKVMGAARQRSNDLFSHHQRHPLRVHL